MLAYWKFLGQDSEAERPENKAAAGFKPQKILLYISVLLDCPLIRPTHTHKHTHRGGGWFQCDQAADRGVELVTFPRVRGPPGGRRITELIHSSLQTLLDTNTHKHATLTDNTQHSVWSSPLQCHNSDQNQKCIQKLY